MDPIITNNYFIIHSTQHAYNSFIENFNNQLVRGVEELMDWDLGMNIDHPDFVDVMIPNNAPDPVSFEVGIGLVDQTDELGVGQDNVPLAV